MRRRKGKQSVASAAITNILLIAMTVGLYFALTNGISVSAAAPVYRNGGDGITLMIPCYYDAEAMGDMLDILDEQGSRAVFCITAGWARSNTSHMERIASGGHQAVVMTAMDDTVSRMRDELDAASALCASYGLKAIGYYPGDTPGIKAAICAAMAGLDRIICTADLLCARGGADDIIARAKGAAVPGAILLMQPTRAAADSLRALTDTLTAKGYAVTVISE